MNARVFVDSNVMIYPEDPRDPTKRDIAIELLASLERRDIGAISVQVLSEYANTVTKPHKTGMPHVLAADSVARLGISWDVREVTPDIVAHALHAQLRWGLAFYDAQIWATAASNGIPLVLSEDFPDGLELGPVRFKNPFAEGFDLEVELGALGG